MCLTLGEGLSRLAHLPKKAKVAASAMPVSPRVEPFLEGREVNSLQLAMAHPEASTRREPKDPGSSVSSLVGGCREFGTVAERLMVLSAIMNQSASGVAGELASSSANKALLHDGIASHEWDLQDREEKVAAREDEAVAREGKLMKREEQAAAAVAAY